MDGMSPERRHDMMTRARLLRGTTMALAGSVLAACATPATSQPTAEIAPGAEVVYMRQATEVLERSHTAQAARFNQVQSRVKARFENAGGTPADWLAKLTAMLATDTAPDIFLLIQEILPPVAATGALYDLTPLLTRDSKEVNPSDFFPSAIEGCKWQGRQVALSAGGCAILEYYNATLFQEAGLPFPTPTWAWEDYLDTARKLTKKDSSGNVVQAGLGTAPEGLHVWSWLWAGGNNVFSADFKQAPVNERNVIEPVQFAVDLIQTHGVAAQSPGVALGPNPMQNGKVAMWRANRAYYGAIETLTSYKVNVVPIARPAQATYSTTVTSPGNYRMAKSNKRANAAWEWFKFMISTEGQIIGTEISGGCPSRKSTTQHPSYSQKAIPALASVDANKTFADALVDPRTARVIPGYVAVNEAQAILIKHIGTAWKGEQSVPAAMTIARQELESLLVQKPQPVARS